MSESSKHTIASIAGYICSGFFIISLPIWVSAVIDDFKITEQAGGNLATLEIGCVALGMLITSRRVHTINRRGYALAGASVAIAANILAASTSSFDVLIASRVFVGLGLGVLLVCALSTAAGTLKSQQTFAYMEACLAIVAAMFYTVSAWQLELHGASGVFAVLALGQFFCLPLLGYIPVINSKKQSQASYSEKISFTAKTGVLANALFYTSMFSFWTFVSRIGLSIDVSNEMIGRILSVAFIASLISTLSVPFLSRRFGYRPLVIFVVAVMAIASLMLTNTKTLMYFATAVVLLKFHFLFYSTMMNGLFANEENSGRSNGYGLAFAIIGTTVGPALGGWVLSFSDYRVLGWIACLIWLVCLPLLYVLANAVDKKQTTKLEQ